jgi:hypothetical protein
MKMMKLWIGNVDPEATDDDVRALIAKYTKLECSELTRVPGDGSRPAVMLELSDANIKEVYEAQRRLDGLHWRKRTLLVTVV